MCTLTSKQQCALKRGFNRHQKVNTVASFSGRRESHGQSKDCFGVAQTGFEWLKKPDLFSISQPVVGDKDEIVCTFSIA